MPFSDTLEMDDYMPCYGNYDGSKTEKMSSATAGYRRSALAVPQRRCSLKGGGCGCSRRRMRRRSPRWCVWGWRGDGGVGFVWALRRLCGRWVEARRRVPLGCGIRCLGRRSLETKERFVLVSVSQEAQDSQKRITLWRESVGYARLEKGDTMLRNWT